MFSFTILSSNLEIILFLAFNFIKSNLSSYFEVNKFLNTSLNSNLELQINASSLSTKLIPRFAAGEITSGTPHNAASSILTRRPAPVNIGATNTDELYK